MGFIAIVYSGYSIDISGCSNLSSAGSTYYLTTDILNSSTNNCINISANNVVFDCLGHLVHGNGSVNYGIYINRDTPTIANVTVKNCIISNWGMTNVYLKSTYLVNIFNITTSNSGRGIDTYYSSNISLNNISSYNNIYGVYLEELYDSDFKNSYFYNNSMSGLYFWYGNRNIFSNIIFIKNGETIGRSGIRLHGALSNNLTNISISNSYSGIYGYYFSRNILTNFSISNTNYGIFLDSDLVNSNIIKDSSIKNNNSYNLYFYFTSTGPFNNTFYNNYLGNRSKIRNNYNFGTNYFNTTIGNRWDDFNSSNCSSVVDVSGYSICTNPSNYTINSSLNIYDYRPFNYTYTAPVVESSTSSLNSIFPVYGFNSVLISFGIIFSYFLFN